MVVERTAEGILIKTTVQGNMKVVQKIIDYYTALEINSRAQGTEEEVLTLTDEINKKWWDANKHRFLK